MARYCRYRYRYYCPGKFCYTSSIIVIYNKRLLTLLTCDNLILKIILVRKTTTEKCRIVWCTKEMNNSWECFNGKRKTKTFSKSNECKINKK